jgi:hypothetical protein
MLPGAWLAARSTLCPPLPAPPMPFPTG